MQKRKKLFERIPLAEVPKVGGGNETENARPAKPTIANNVQKRAARPKRSIKMEGDDHPIGLWIDREIFRRHQNGRPQIVLHDPLASANSRYLTLADLALGNNRARLKK